MCKMTAEVSPITILITQLLFLNEFVSTVFESIATIDSNGKQTPTHN